MGKFADKFYRGINELSKVENFEGNPRAKASAFRPNWSNNSEDHLLETSIVWELDENALPYFVDKENKKGDKSLILGGVSYLEYDSVITDISADCNKSLVSFNNNRDKNDPDNIYHGNIQFDASIYFIEFKDGKPKYDRQYINHLCSIIAFNTKTKYLSPDELKQQKNMNLLICKTPTPDYSLNAQAQLSSDGFDAYKQNRLSAAD